MCVFFGSHHQNITSLKAVTFSFLSSALALLLFTVPGTLSNPYCSDCQSKAEFSTLALQAQTILLNYKPGNMNASGTSLP